MQENTLTQKKMETTGSEDDHSDGRSDGEEEKAMLASPGLPGLSYAYVQSMSPDEKAKYELMEEKPNKIRINSQKAASPLVISW